MVSTAHFKHGTLDNVTFSNLPSIRLEKLAYTEKSLKKPINRLPKHLLGLYK